MPLTFKRYSLTSGDWTQICLATDESVTIENLGTYIYQGARIVAAPTEPDLNTTDFRSIAAGRQQTLMNIEDGTILWARAVNQPVEIEVMAQ